MLILLLKAIHCRLAGIKPPTLGDVGVDTWEKDISDKIYDVIDTYRSLYAKMVRNVDQQCEVMLVDTSGDEDILINKVLVDEGLAVCDDEMGHLFCSFDESYSTDSDYNSNNSSPNSLSDNSGGGNSPVIIDGIDFSQFESGFSDEFRDEFLKQTFGIEQSKNEAPNPQVNPKRVNATVNNEIERVKARTETERVNARTETGLNYIAKVPNVEWQQSDDLIVLTIVATENLNYSLRVTDSDLVYG